MKKLLFIDDGIEFDSETVRSKPSGGAENAFVSLVEALAERKFDVNVFNNCKNQGLINKVKWRKLDSKINDENFDTLIINRGDKFLNFKSECKRRIFWIHNPANYLLKYRYLKKLILNPAKIIFSSEYHLNTYPKWAPFKQKVIIPYGVDSFIIKKISHLNLPKPNVIFTSNPQRGLQWLLDRWVYEIHPVVPEAKLFLFSGIETYGDFGKKNLSEILPIIERAKNLKKKGVFLKKPVKRGELLRFLKNSRLHLYEGSNDETFCMSIAESQVLGIPCVVKNFGCMNERIINNRSGFVCKSDKEFSQKAIKILTQDKCWLKMHQYMIKNNLHYSWKKIAEMWEKEI